MPLKGAFDTPCGPAPPSERDEFDIASAVELAMKPTTAILHQTQANQARKHLSTGLSLTGGTVDCFVSRAASWTVSRLCMLHSRLLPAQSQCLAPGNCLHDLRANTPAVRSRGGSVACWLSDTFWRSEPLAYTIGFPDSCCAGYPAARTCV